MPARLRGLALVALLGAGACDPLWFLPAEDIQRARDRDGDGSDAWQAGGDDCDDTDPQVHPGTEEVCDDGIDNDCNGLIDNLGVGSVTWYVDADADGYGRNDLTSVGCPTVPPGLNMVMAGGDCDDFSPEVHPGATDDNCDGVDDNCSGFPDDDGQLYWPDADGDGRGDATARGRCRQEPGLVPTGDDCNDQRADVHAGAAEVCDGADNDCDGTADEGGGASIGTTRYASLAEALAVGTPEEGVVVVGVCAQAAPHEPGTIRVNVGQTVILSGPGASQGTVQAPPSGTLIEVEDGGAVSLDRLTIAGGSGGRTLMVSGRLEMEGSVVEGARGGALWVEGLALLYDSELRDNEGPRGGAVIVAEHGDVVVDRTVVTGNLADKVGGAVYIESALRGRFEARDSDFGTGTGENVPDDVDLAGESFDVEGSGVSFVCDGGCR